MSMTDHVESLRTKHATLERAIDDELHRPLPDQALLARLKKQKLKIKDEITRLDETETLMSATASSLH
ncbi:MAG: YdcH family protein [Geminicoccaceae bacterium]